MRLLLILFLTSLSCLNLSSQISVKTEYLGTSSYKKRNTKTDKSEKIGDSKGSAMVYQGSVNIPLSTKINRNKQPTLWGVSLAGAYVDLRNKNFTEDLVLDEMMNLGLSLYHLRPISNRWSLLMSAGGGIFTPTTQFSKIRFKNVLGTGAVVFIRQMNKNLELGGGVAFNNSFGVPMVFPAIYVNWRTQSKIAVKVSMMDGLSLLATYKVTDFLSLNLVVEMNGQMALLEKDGKDKMFTHQYIIAGFRSEFTIDKRLTIPITAGISATRGAQFSDRKLKSMFMNENYAFEAAPYISAGLSLRL